MKAFQGVVVVRGFLVAGLISALAAGSAAAKDKVRLVDSQAMVFDTFSLYQAQAEGYYEAENLDASIIVGRGGADSLQAVVTGSQDIVWSVGILSVISAYAKGAPITIIANCKRGSSEILWYVPKDSPIKSFKDLDGKDMAYSAPGSVTHLIVQTAAAELGIKPKFVAVGAASASRTQVMSGQVQTGWTVFPANMDLIRKGEARQIGSGDDADALKGASIRIVAANTNWLDKNRDVAVRTMRAIWKGQQYNFSGDKAIARFADHWKIDAADAMLAKDFFKAEEHTFAPIGKLDGLLALALQHGFIKEPLTETQKKGLVTIIYDPKRPG
jgi:NitT/TauT family transport system substrate-binding protein